MTSSSRPPRSAAARAGAVHVLIAHESDSIRETVRRLISDAGYVAHVAADGETALAVAREQAPTVMVIDVALPRLLGYEVVERLRRTGTSTRSILVASVYNRTGYKRKPTTLYGADDYIEQHHIPDQLLIKIAKLLPEGDAPRIGPPDPTEGAEIRRAGEGRLRIRYATVEEGHTRAQRLARLIISDIALYNGAELDEGIRRGDLSVRLRDDLEEGRLLFDLRVPEEIRGGHDFIAEALAEFVRDRQRSGGG
jgi:DNA-binding response OmpR family regulator